MLQSITHIKYLLRSLYSEFLKVRTMGFDKVVACKIIDGTDSEVMKLVKSQLGFKSRNDPCKSTAHKSSRGSA